MRARWISKARMLALALSIVAPLGVLGCDVRDGDNSDFAEFDVTVGQVTTANAAEVLPGGPDAIGGVGDFFLRNGRVSLIVDQVAQDPNTGNLAPLQELAGFSGGSLVDFASEAGGLVNDQLNQFALTISGSDANGNAIFPFFFPARYTQLEVGVDTADRCTLVATGVFLVLDATTIIEGTTIRQDVGITGGTGIFPGINFGADIDLSDLGTAPVLCSDEGVGIPDSNDLPVIVRTTYALSRDNTHVDIQSVIFNPGPAADVRITNMLDILLTGGDQGNNVKFSVPFGTGGIDGLFDEVSDFVFAAQKAAGQSDQVARVAADATAETFVPAAIVTPYVAVTGDDDPGISYAVCDQVVGLVAEARGGGAVVGVISQVTTQPTIPQNDVLVHSRVIATGVRGDVGSAIDEVNQLLSDQIIRANPDTGIPLPNIVNGVGTILGVTNPPVPGATVTIVQDKPGVLFVPDDDPVQNALNFAAFLAGDDTNDNIDTDVVFAPFAGFLLTVVHDLSSTVTQADGTFSALVPAGVYTITVTGAQEGTDVVTSLTVLAGAASAADFNLNTMGTATFTVVDGGAAASPAKLTFIGVSGAAPNFGNLERAAGVGNIVYTASGSGSVEMPAGTYDVIATRGIEFSADREQNVVIAAGGTTAIPQLQLIRLVDTPGFLSADYHIHSGRSFDSTVPLNDRVISFLANGVEVMVATDHDVNTDYGPTIAGLDVALTGTVDVDGQITSFVGSELTAFVPFAQFPQTIGHYNAWPLAFSDILRRNGAPDDEFRGPGLLFDVIRGTGAAAGLQTLVQLNHPHGGINLGRAIGLFDADQPNPANSKFSTPLTNADINDLENPVFNLSQGASITSNVGFDTMEVFNGSQTGQTADTATNANDQFLTEFIETRADWFALMNRSQFKVATANSDSHFIADQNGTTDTDMAGYPRTYFASAVTDLSTLDVNVMNAVLRSRINEVGVVDLGAAANAGNAFCSSGPIIIVTVDEDEDAGAGTAARNPGEFILNDGDESVDLNIQVLAAPWVPVGEIRIVVNGGGVAGVDPNIADDTDGSFVVVLAPTLVPGDDFSIVAGDVIRFNQTVTVDLTGGGTPTTDSWIVVEASSFVSTGGELVFTSGNSTDGNDADGDAVNEGAEGFNGGVATPATLAPPGGTYNQVAPGFIPYGFTNPIIIDNNNGVGTVGTFDEPGLP